jgi:predicted ATPase/DNA-binding CsgD family transcriptional regulator
MRQRLFNGCDPQVLLSKGRVFHGGGAAPRSGRVDNASRVILPPPSNLPAELTSFIGRETQLAELRRLLLKSRLVTLTGPGGVGKTRLALRLAMKVRERFPGGVWLAELGSVSDPDLVDRTVAAACLVPEDHDRPIVESLLSHLKALKVLIILDSAEHLVEASGALAVRLLRGCPGLTLLQTSREPLGHVGEMVWRTPSLSLPASDQRSETAIKRSEAVQLFLARAALAKPGFSLQDAAPTELADLCIRLEGLPLAIELAASLVGAMSVREIRDRLTDRYRLLTGGRSLAVPRQKTLQQAIDWSYELLSSEERAFFARLSILVGGFDIDAAEAVGSMDGEEVLPALVSLVQKSLVVAELRSSGRTRYRMLDTIREYAVDKLSTSDSRQTRERHADHFLRFAQTAARQMRTGEQAAWLDRIEEETPNLRLASSWFETEDPDKLMDMTGLLSRYWYVRGRLTEGLEWLDRALQAPAKHLASRLPALQARGRLRRHRGDYDGALSDAQECVALARKTGSDLHLMGGLVTLGNLSASLARWPEARRYCAAALELQRAIDDPGLIAGGLNNLALVESAQGNQAQAKQRVVEALALVERTGDRILKGSLLETAGRIERRMGNRAAAKGLFLEAIALAVEFGDVVNLTDVLDGLSLLALAQGDATRAVTLAAVSHQQRSTSQSEPPRWDQEEVKAGLAAARSALGSRAAAAAWRQGADMNITEAVLFAKRSDEPNGRNTTTALTRRETQVADLIAKGMTNREIAAQLQMAGRTADAHVEHIRNKLGVRTRTQIAVWTRDHKA